MEKKEKNKDLDEFGNITFGEATELLVDIIGQIVILEEFIPKEEHGNYKRSLERIYDGQGPYSKITTAPSKSPQSYFARFFKEILEDKYKFPPFVMPLVDSFTWQFFYALTSNMPFEKPKKETVLFLARKQLFNFIYYNLLREKPMDDGSNLKIPSDSPSDSIKTFLEYSYVKFFSDAEDCFAKNEKSFINELKKYWNKNYKNYPKVYKTDPIQEADPLQEITNELLNDDGIFYNEIKDIYGIDNDLKKRKPKLYNLLQVDKNDKHFSQLFKEAIEEFIEYGINKDESIDSIIFEIPKSKIKYPYLHSYINSGKIDLSEIDFNFDDDIQNWREGKNVYNATWKILEPILDFLRDNGETSLVCHLIGLYLLKNTQRAMEEILSISKEIEQKQIIEEIKTMINENKKPEYFYNDNDIVFLEYSNLIFICLASQHYLDIEKSNEIITVIEDKCKKSKKFFSPWLKARTMVFENGESLKENKEEQNKIIASYKKAYDDGVAYAGGYLGQFLLEAIVINRFIKSDDNRNIKPFYGYGYALEIFGPEKEKLLDIIKEASDPRMEFVNIHYSNFSPMGRIISQYYSNPRSITELEDKAILMNNKGLAFEKTGDFESAEQCFSAAIILNPVYVNAYSSRGNVYSKMGEPFADKALADFNMALLLDSKHENTLFWRGWLLLKKGQYENAITDFTEVININPEDSETYLRRGICYRYLENIDLAIKDYSKAIEINPNYAEAYCNRGVIHKLMGNDDKAQEDLRKAKEIDQYFFLKDNMAFFL